MHDHAGTVIGGMTEVRRPCRPRSMRPPRLGSSPRQRSSTSDGSAQSSPTIITFETATARRPTLAVEVAERAQPLAHDGHLVGRHPRVLELPVVRGDEVAEHVHAELGDRAEARALDDVREPFVERTGYLERHIARPARLRL